MVGLTLETARDRPLSVTRRRETVTGIVIVIGTVDATVEDRDLALDLQEIAAVVDALALVRGDAIADRTLQREIDAVMSATMARDATETEVLTTVAAQRIEIAVIATRDAMIDATTAVMTADATKDVETASRGEADVTAERTGARMSVTLRARSATVMTSVAETSHQMRGRTRIAAEPHLASQVNLNP